MIRISSKFKNILFAEKCINLGEIKIKEGGASQVEILICFFNQFVSILLLDEGNNQVFIFCSINNNPNSRNILNEEFYETGYF